MTEYHAYAGFWRRFGALWVDILVCFPLLFINYWVCITTHSKFVIIGTYILVAVLIQAYTIYCHGRWGRTIGKLVTGVKIVSLDFQPISWGQSFKRSSVDILFTISACYGVIIASMCFSDAGLGATGVMRFNKLAAWYPPWQEYSNRASQVWVWSEFIIMMTNSRRRALHDFIAGTVVIQVRGNKWDKDNPYFKDYSKEIKRVEKMKDPFKI